MAKCVLGDVAKRIQTGPFGSQLHQADYSPSGTPVVMPKDLADGTIVDATIARVGPRHVERLAKHKLKEGDLLFSRRGDVGRCALVRKEQEGWLCGTGCLRVELDSEKADYNYLYYFLRRDDVAKWLESHAVGAIMLNINPSIVSQLPIALPPIDVQRNIAKVLSSIDRKIALNRKRIATLEAMAKEIYDYWFVQFDFPDAHGRPYKSSGGAMVYNPDLKREIPKGWEVKPLGEIAEVVNGATPATANPRNYDGDVVWITPKDLSDQRSKFTYGGNRTISREGYDSCSTHMLPRGSILMSSRAPIGLLSIAAVDLCTNQGFKSFVPKEIDDNLYLYYYLKEHMAQIEAMGSGTTFKEVSRESMITFPIPYVSDREVYASFVAIVKPIFNQQELLGKELARLSALRDFLLPVLMNGQVKVG